MGESMVANSLCIGARLLRRNKSPCVLGSPGVSLGRDAGLMARSSCWRVGLVALIAAGLPASLSGFSPGAGAAGRAPIVVTRRGGGWGANVRSRVAVSA
jgi:hypothetical protein